MRGKGERIRLILEYLGLDYEMFLFHRENPSEWDDYKKKNIQGLDFPNLPFLIDGNLKMTESWAIMRYLAHKNHNQLSSEPGQEEINCDMASGVVKDFRTKFMLMIYNKNFDEMREEYAKILPAKLDLFENFLSNKTWLSGSKLTFIDFAFWEVLDRHLMMFPDCLENHKCLKQYYQNFQDLPAIKNYRESNRFHKYPVHKVHAFWGHGP